MNIDDFGKNPLATILSMQQLFPLSVFIDLQIDQLIIIDYRFDRMHKSGFNKSKKQRP